MYGLPFSVALLGPFEARYNDRPLTNFATDKIRALLAYLAIESGKSHRRETLASLFWSDYTNEVALRNLRQSVYRLRQTLQDVDPNLPDQLITQNRLTITLNPEFISLDAAHFTQALRDAKQSDDAAPILDQAIALYRGDLLQGFSVPAAYDFEEWLRIQREVFHQHAIDAFSRLLTLHESRGEFDPVFVIAPRLLSLEPWHEETHRQLIRAHLQMGNRPQAIAQFEELKAVLLRDLGVEPSSATIALLAQVETPVGSGTSASSQLYSTQKPVTQRNLIPVPGLPLIGRQPELDYLTQTLQDPACRLLTITGPGGIGKTRLCVEAARLLAGSSTRFSNGIVFIPLAQIEHGSLIVSTVAQVLGITLQSRTDPRQELFNYLQNQYLLFVLDNFEHLLTSTASDTLPDAIAFIKDILGLASGITILVTSREPLAIQTEWAYPLDGLPYGHSKSDSTNPLIEPAPQLFIQNARRYNASFDPSNNVDAIVDICRLTDGLPLAIEMAATWLRVYTCQEIAQSISQSLDFLTSPFRDAPVRQRSIRVILDATWEQLNPEQQEVLMTLSVFRGGFTIQAALAVTEAHVLDLSILVEKSLIRRTDNKRYFLHELVAQFAGEKLADSGNGPSIQENHARFYFETLNVQMLAFSGPNPADALAYIRQDLDNLRAAWNSSVSQASPRLLEMGLKGLAQFWVFTGAYLEGEIGLQKAITAVQSLPPDPQVISLHSSLASSLAWIQMGINRNTADVEKNLQTALALAGEVNNLECRAIALSHQGWLLQNQGQLDEAETVLNEACTLFEKIGDQFQLSLALVRTGSVYWWRNMMEKALGYYEQSLRIEQRLGNKRGINRAYSGLGMAHMYLENFEQALEYMEKALQLDRELGNQTGIVRNLGHLGNIYLRKGKYAMAAARYKEALEVEQKTGSKNTVSIWLSKLGRVYFRQRDYDKALAYYEEAVFLANENANKHQLCEALLGKGAIMLLRQQWGDAQMLIEQGLTISYEIDRKDTKLRALVLKARWLARTGEPQKARQLLESSRETLASEYKETETKARLHYELWKIDHQVEDAQQALDLYETCQSRAEQIEYTERIAELTSQISDRP